MQKIELIQSDIGGDSAVVTDEDGKERTFLLTESEALIVGALIGLQIAIDKLAEKNM